MDSKTSGTYDSSIGEKANAPLAKRLQLLVGANSRVLADYLGCSIQAVNQYKQGTAYPKTENLIKIADFYHVSVDYLLGITDIPNRDSNVTAVCQYIGLSPDTVEFLHKKRNGPFGPEDMFPRAVDFLIDDARYNRNDYGSLLKMISAYMELDSAGNKSVYTLNANGEIKKARSDVAPDGKRYVHIPSNAVAFDSDMLDAIALTTISQKIAALKRARQQKKDG